MSGLPQRTYVEREDPGKYSLSNSERKDLINEDSNTYPKGTLNKKLAEKAKNISRRYEGLLEDVALLNESGHLKDNFQEEELNRLIEAACNEIPTHDSGILFSDKRKLSNGGKLGFWTGQFLNRLISGSQSKLKKSKIVQGFALSLLGDQPSISSLPQIRGNIEGAESDIQETIGKAEIDKMYEAIAEMADISVKRHEEVQDIIAARETSKHNNSKMEGLIERQLRSHQINPDEFLVAVIFRIMDEIEEETGEIPYIGEIDEEIKRLNTHTPLSEIENLRTEMKSDKNNIPTKYRGINVHEILEYIYQETGIVERDDMAAEFGISHHVTGLLNKLSDGKDDENDEDDEDNMNDNQQWTNRPIVEQVEENKWILTEYGDLLCHMMFEYNHFGRVLYEYAVYNSEFRTEIADKYDDDLRRFIDMIGNYYDANVAQLVRTSLEHN